MINEGHVGQIHHDWHKAHRPRAGGQGQGRWRNGAGDCSKKEMTDLINRRLRLYNMMLETHILPHNTRNCEYLQLAVNIFLFHVAETADNECRSQ